MSTHIPGRDVFVVDGARTPFLKARGKPGPFSASDLAVCAGRDLLLRQPFSADQLDEVIIGSAMPGPDEANIGRVIALRLGCGEKVPAWTVQRNCASGMQALDNAAQNIAEGRADLVLAGGTDAMSHAPLLFGRAMVNWLGGWYGAKSLGARLKLVPQLRPQFFVPIIALMRGLTDPIVGLSMGQTAENLAFRFGITRDEMDAFSVRSHERLAHAQDEGFLSEITALYDTKEQVFGEDDGLRRDSSIEKLAKLKPFFDKKFGNVTPGNSSQVTDGAAVLLLASAEAVKKYKLSVLGRIVDSEWAALDPAQMGLGPVFATPPLLQRHKLGFGDIDYWEINEAFSAQVIACLHAWADKDFCKEQLGLKQALGTIDPDRLNIDGGAVALGHPVGASGARIVLHLLEILKRNKAKRGLASICVGGGQGGAMLIESFQ